MWQWNGETHTACFSQNRLNVAIVDLNKAIWFCHITNLIIISKTGPPLMMSAGEWDDFLILKFPPSGCPNPDIVVLTETGSSWGSSFGLSSLNRRLHDGAPIAGMWCYISISWDFMFAVAEWFWKDYVSGTTCVSLLFKCLPLNVVKQGTRGSLKRQYFVGCLWWTFEESYSKDHFSCFWLHIIKLYQD